MNKVFCYLVAALWFTFILACGGSPQPRHTITQSCGSGSYVGSDGYCHSTYQSQGSSHGRVQVRGYHRRDGTYVRSHSRRR